MGLVLTAFVVSAASITAASHPALRQHPLWMWLIVLVPHLCLAGLGIYRMWDAGTLSERLAPRWGDFSLGAILTFVLLPLSWWGKAWLAPAGAPEQGWLMQIELQLGEPMVSQRSALLTIAVLLSAAAQEVTWRGMVLEDLEARWGWRMAALATTLMFAAAHAPTLFTLRDPTAGLNPLLVTAALVCGFVWSFLTVVIGRVWPAIISHMAFLYYSAMQVRIPGLTDFG